MICARTLSASSDVALEMPRRYPGSPGWHEVTGDRRQADGNGGQEKSRTETSGRPYRKPTQVGCGETREAYG